MFEKRWGSFFRDSNSDLVEFEDWTLKTCISKIFAWILCAFLFFLVVILVVGKKEKWEKVASYTMSTENRTVMVVTIMSRPSFLLHNLYNGCNRWQQPKPLTQCCYATVVVDF